MAVCFKGRPRIKDGKEHRYWSVVENRRCGKGTDNQQTHRPNEGRILLAQIE